MLLASALGAAGFIWWITALIAMVFPNKRAAAWRLLIAVGFTWTVNEFDAEAARGSGSALRG